MSALTDTKALLPKARALVIEHRRGSISLVQRYLRIGYNAAAELLEMLEAEGTVGPIEGAGGRKVLIERGSTAANGSQKPDDAPQLDAPKLATDSGPTAFPCAGREIPGGWSGPSDGMSLRDYFAAKAMPRLLDLEITSVWNQGMGVEGKRDSALCVAKIAYLMADAMLKARQS